MLQAQESHTPLSFFQSAKLVKAIGEPLRALQELDNALRGMESGREQEATRGVIDLTIDHDGRHDDEEIKRVEGKVSFFVVKQGLLISRSN